VTFDIATFGLAWMKNSIAFAFVTPFTMSQTK
jgi:hypothetical protein